MLRPSTVRTWTYCPPQEAWAITLTATAATALTVRAELPAVFAASLVLPLLIILLAGWRDVIATRRQRAGRKRDIEAKRQASQRRIDDLDDLEDEAATALEQRIHELEQQYEQLLTARMTADESQARRCNPLRAEKARVAQLLSEWRADLVELRRVYAEARAAALAGSPDGTEGGMGAGLETNPRAAAVMARGVLDRARRR